jgi:hypothetical protein
MAYHYTEKGHSPMVVGALYSRTTSHHDLYKLKTINTATGMCKLTYEFGVVLMSEAELSNWHLVRRENGT